MEIPYLIKFDSIGNDSIGFLGVAENNVNVPFDVKRIFWTYQTPNGIERGRHAHIKTKQVLICLQGNIRITTIQPDGSKKAFLLTAPNTGLYLPPTSWHTMIYQDNAIQLVLASELYDPNDYIRDFDTFIKINND